MYRLLYNAAYLQMNILYIYMLAIFEFTLMDYVEDADWLQ